MKTLLYKIPFALLYSRLVIAVLLIVFSFIAVSPGIIITLSIYAIVSDIFDGMLARHLKISTVKMRQTDTKIDTVFWLGCLFYLCMHHTAFIKTYVIQLIILVSSECIIILFGLLKFNERISYHTILSKVWALILLWFFIDLVSNDTSYISFTIAFWYGLMVQFEILAIAIILKINQTDVPGLVQAIKLRKGLLIKKNRFFNG